MAALDSLYRDYPDLFINRRIILAQDMDEVMRQALIGYDKTTYDRAESLILNGIRDYTEAWDEEALKEFQEASQLTPENAVISAWITEVKRALSEPVSATSENR